MSIMFIIWAEQLYRGCYKYQINAKKLQKREELCPNDGSVSIMYCNIKKAGI